jgi:imidazolonepropionase-like amidohydrolase
VAPGKLADIVVWDNDPIQDSTILQRPTEISIIVKDGKIVNREVEGFGHLKGEPPRAKAYMRS